MGKIKPFQFHVAHDKEHDTANSWNFWIVCYETEEGLKKKLEGHGLKEA